MSRRCRALALRVLRLRLLSTGVLQRLAALVERVFDALDTYRDVPRMLVALVLALLFQVHRAVFLWDLRLRPRHRRQRFRTCSSRCR